MLPAMKPSDTVLRALPSAYGRSWDELRAEVEKLAVLIGRIHGAGGAS